MTFLLRNIDVKAVKSSHVLNPDWQFNFSRTSSLQGQLEEQGDVGVHFKATKDIFGINLREEGVSLLLKGTLTKE